MRGTRRDPDNDRSYCTPHAWRNAKLAFGWKPGTGRKGSSSLIAALLDLEDHARSDGGCVRSILELAIRNHLRVAHERKWQLAEIVRKNGECSDGGQGGGRVRRAG